MLIRTGNLNSTPNGILLLLWHFVSFDHAFAAEMPFHLVSVGQILRTLFIGDDP